MINLFIDRFVNRLMHSLVNHLVAIGLVKSLFSEWTGFIK